MRTINTDEIIQTVKKMCIEANLKLSEDMEKAEMPQQKKTVYLADRF